VVAVILERSTERDHVDPPATQHRDRRLGNEPIELLCSSRFQPVGADLEESP